MTSLRWHKAGILGVGAVEAHPGDHPFSAPGADGLGQTREIIAVGEDETLLIGCTVSSSARAVAQSAAEQAPDRVLCQLRKASGQALSLTMHHYCHSASLYALLERRPPITVFASRTGLSSWAMTAKYESI